SCGDECEFNLRLCADVDTPDCTPTKIDELRVQGDTDGLALERPAVPVDRFECGAHLSPVRLKLGAKQREKRTLKISAIRNGRPRRLRRDKDVLKLICERS